MNYLNGKFLADANIKARNEGITYPHQIKLHQGQIIYRFYDSSTVSNPMKAIHRPWWIEYEYFQKIKHFALQHNYTFSYAARLFTAILYEWSEVDSYIRCQVKEPIIALKGRGKQVDSKGKDSRDLPTMTPMQSVLEIYQLYLPGFDGETSIADSAVTLLQHQKI